MHVAPDCTHFCYTPLFWDAVFGGVYRALRRTPLGKKLARSSRRSVAAAAAAAQHGAASGADGGQLASGLKALRRRAAAGFAQLGGGGLPAAADELPARLVRLARGLVGAATPPLEDDV